MSKKKIALLSISFLFFAVYLCSVYSYESNPAVKQTGLITDKFETIPGISDYETKMYFETTEKHIAYSGYKPVKVLTANTTDDSTLYEFIIVNETNKPESVTIEHMKGNVNRIVKSSLEKYFVTDDISLPTKDIKWSIYDAESYIDNDTSSLVNYVSEGAINENLSEEDRDEFTGIATMDNKSIEVNDVEIGIVEKDKAIKEDILHWTFISESKNVEVVYMYDFNTQSDKLVVTYRTVVNKDTDNESTYNMKEIFVRQSELAKKIS